MNRREYPRRLRLAELLREILAEELERIDEEDAGLVTITGINVDDELHRAEVRYTTIGDDDAAAAFLRASAGQMKRAIGSQTRVRRVPELIFVPDAGQQNADRVEEILRGLHDSGDLE